MARSRMRCAYAPGNGSPQFETWDPGGQQLLAYRTKRQVAAGRTMDIPDLVPKSGDDTAPARSNEEKFLSPITKVNQLVCRTPSAL